MKLKIIYTGKHRHGITAADKTAIALLVADQVADRKTQVQRLESTKGVNTVAFSMLVVGDLVSVDLFEKTTTPVDTKADVPGATKAATKAAKKPAAKKAPAKNKAPTKKAAAKKAPAKKVAAKK